MARVETKVTAASLGAALPGLVVTLLGEHVWHEDIPPGVTDVVYVAVPPPWRSLPDGSPATHPAAPPYEPDPHA
jgi:hypothetical protein